MSNLELINWAKTSKYYWTLFKQLIEQYKKIKTNGITYKLHNNTFIEQHFDFKNTLIKEIQTQFDSINNGTTQNWKTINQQWQKGVGGAQKLLPTHVVDEYCSHEPFNPVPKFTSKPSSSRQFYPDTNNNPENWFNKKSLLGCHVAVFKGHWKAGRASTEMTDVLAIRCDLEALNKLIKLRTQNFVDLESQLEQQMIVNTCQQTLIQSTTCQ